MEEKTLPNARNALEKSGYKRKTEPATPPDAAPPLRKAEPSLTRHHANGEYPSLAFLALPVSHLSSTSTICNMLGDLVIMEV